jgi:hypothetical protein
MNAPNNRCHAHSSRTGEPCKKWAVTGKKVCMSHGGAAGAGGLSSIKTGRYSKALGKLAAGYESSLNDRQLFDLREPIAALDGVTKRLMNLVEEHDSPEWRRSVASKYKQVREALANGDEHATRLLEELGELINKGAAEASNLEALGSNLDKLARRIEGAWSIHLAKTQVMNKGEIVGLLAKIVVLIRDEGGNALASRVQSRLLAELSTQMRPQLEAQPDDESSEIEEPPRS